MQDIDIIEGIKSGIREVLFKNWKHYVYIEDYKGDVIYFSVDGEHYTLKFNKEDKNQYKNRHKTVEEYLEDCE